MFRDLFKVLGETSKMKDIKQSQKTLTELSLEVASCYGVHLDFSVNSVKRVDRVLSRVREEYIKTKDEDGLRGIALEMAAYIITVIEKNIVVGKWERNSIEMGKETFPYDLGSGNIIFPYIWNLKRIYDGAGDNVWAKFKALVLERVGRSD